MSGDPSNPEAPSDETHERPGVTLGIAVGLLLVLGPIAGLVLGALGARGEALDGEAFVAEVFRRGAIPFGLELAEAVKLASGESVVRFELATPEEGRTRPDELIFLEYPAREAARRVFLSGVGDRGEGGRRERRRKGEEAGREASANLARWERDPSFAWHTTMDAGVVDWSRWRADFRIERSFREGGTWVDSGRVDLCQEGRNLVLFGRWPVGLEVDEEHLRELLVELAMLEPKASEG